MYQELCKNTLDVLSSFNPHKIPWENTVTASFLDEEDEVQKD